MATSIDHLKTDHWVYLLKSFHDARGKYHEVGESGWIVNLKLDWLGQEILIEWERDQQRETMHFSLTAKTGPGNGRMKEYFELGKYVPSQRPGYRFIPELGHVSAAQTELPPLTDALIRDENRVEEALLRVWALAGRKRFAEAREQLLAIPGSWNQFKAEKLGAAAKLHVFDANGEVYEWLRDRSIDHWYSWGSEATSGGDGACRLLDIKPAMEHFKKLDEYRQTLKDPQTTHSPE